MLSSRASLLATGVLPFLIAGHRAPGAVKVPLEGAWKIVQASFSGPDTSWTIRNPQPSLYLFTRRHYSIMSVPGSEPRTLFKDGSPPTDAEKLAAYDSFIANSGTYAIADSTLTIRPIVAKNPNLMARGSGQSFVYGVRGDSLWLTLTPPGAAPTSKLRVTLVRVE